MPDVIVHSFSSGELSPSVYGRTDLRQYQEAAADLQNMIVMPSGAARKRPGTWYTKSLSGSARLFSFQKSATETYAVVIANGSPATINIYSVDKNTTTLIDNFTDTDYNTLDLSTLRAVQSADTMVFVSRGAPPKLLRHTGAAAPTGPFTWTPSPAFGPPPLDPTFDTTTANKRPGAVAFSDQRLVFGGTNAVPNGIWGSAVQALEIYHLATTTSSSSAYGVWATKPLMIAELGTIQEVRSIWGLEYTRNATVLEDVLGRYKIGHYIDKGTDLSGPPTFFDLADETSVLSGTPLSNAINFSANPGAINPTDPYFFLVLDYGFIDIKWLAVSSKLSNGILFAGTSQGLYALVGADAGGSISPSSGIISARRQAAVGCSDVPGLVVDNYMVFVDSTKRRLRVAQFNVDTDVFETPRLNDLAEHLFESDIKEVHYSSAPHTILWVLLDDGSVRTFSYDATGSLNAWTPQVFGGDATVESMVVLPGEEEDTVVFVKTDGDEYWLSTLASFNESDQSELCFSDDAIRYEVETGTAITGITLTGTDPVQVTFASNPFSDGDYVTFDSVGGTVELNGATYVVESATGTTIDLADTDSSDFTPWTSAGTCALSPRFIGNLDHLDGEDIVIFADGATHPGREVDSDAIELNRDVEVAIVGRPYTAVVETLPPPEAQAYAKRISRLFVRFYRSLGAKAGDGTEFEEIIPFRSPSFEMDSAPELYTGIKEIPYFGRYNNEVSARVFSDSPTPFYVLNVIYRMEAYG